MKTNEELLYVKISAILEQQIKEGVLRSGDRLPSVRSIRESHQVSMNTAKQVYYELERKGLVEARERSGFYVSRFLKSSLPFPSVSTPAEDVANFHDPDELIKAVFGRLENKDIMHFSLGIPDPALLPISKLNKTTERILKQNGLSVFDYSSIAGSLHLRNNICRQAFSWGGKLKADDLVITSGAANAFSLCLQAITSPGDTIAVESPVYFGILQTARQYGLNVIELPTHPRTGIALEALKKVLPKIQACCLISNFNNPLGSCMPPESKKEAVRLLASHGIPLIEDDLYGDIFFGSQRPVPCKSYDEEGMVLWCGSFSKVLAPGYRLGWVAPGKYRDKVLQAKMTQTISSPLLYQEVVADFMENGRYEQHLRRFRNALHANSLKFLQAIAQYFPPGTKVSRPDGGFVLWVELPPVVPAVELFKQALKYQISIAPGRMFTLQEQYQYCMRLSFGMQWNPQIDDKLKMLGKLIHVLQR